MKCREALKAPADCWVAWTHSSLSCTGLVKCKCIYRRICSFQWCLERDSPSLPLWLLAVFLMSYTRNLNFLGRYLGYLECVSQPFCVLVVTAQIVLGRSWKEWKLFPSLILPFAISPPEKCSRFGVVGCFLKSFVRNCSFEIQPLSHKTI